MKNTSVSFVWAFVAIATASFCSGTAKAANQSDPMSASLRQANELIKTASNQVAADDRVFIGKNVTIFPGTSVPDGKPAVLIAFTDEAGAFIYNTVLKDVAETPIAPGTWAKPGKQKKNNKLACAKFDNEALPYHCVINLDLNVAP